MSIRIAVAFAIGLSVCVITVSLIIFIVIFNDINNLYDDVMDEMKEFKAVVDETWTKIVQLHFQSAGKTIFRRSFGSTFLKGTKRQSERCCRLYYAGSPGIPGPAAYYCSCSKLSKRKDQK
uniref:Col_cuticle_N domain-containing protein n=1 Tax=Elaeophora elaphi TaxID=1147741 RepID=A0A0R3S4Q8_9BILA